MSKQTWKVMVAVIFTFGVVAGLLYFAPFVPWRSSSPQEIPLVFSGESKEMSFFQVSLEEFQGLAFDTTYYQISSVEGRMIVVKVFGVQDDTFYQTESLYESPFGFDYVPHYSDGLLTLERIPSFNSYSLGTFIMLIVIAVVCMVICAVAYTFVKEET